MQQFLIDVDKPTGLLVIYAKQADSNLQPYITVYRWQRVA